MTEETVLYNSWDIYYRMPKCTDWTIEGYSIIQKGVQTAEQVVYVLNHLENETIQGGMFYIMRSGIQPIWECVENIQGGFFSFRIQDADTWRNAIYAMIGNTLFLNELQMNCVNGMSVTPKSGFMTLKLWLSGGDIMTLSDMTSIPGLDTTSATFRYHNIQTALPCSRPRHTGNKEGKKGDGKMGGEGKRENNHMNNNRRPTPRQSQYSHTPQKSERGGVNKRWST